MKIIDDKGMVFGKVNIIDLTVLLVGFPLLAVFIYMAINLYRGVDEIEKQNRSIIPGKNFTFSELKELDAMQEEVVQFMREHKIKRKDFPLHYKKFYDRFDRRN